MTLLPWDLLEGLAQIVLIEMARVIPYAVIIPLHFSTTDVPGHQKSTNSPGHSSDVYQPLSHPRAMDALLCQTVMHLPTQVFRVPAARIQINTHRGPVMRQRWALVLKMQPQNY